MMLGLCFALFIIPLLILGIYNWTLCIRRFHDTDHGGAFSRFWFFSGLIGIVSVLG